MNKFMIQQQRTGRYYVSTGIPSDWTHDKSKASVFTEYINKGRTLTEYCQSVMKTRHGKVNIITVV